MNLKLVVLVAVMAAAVEAHPRYIVVPVEDLRLVRHVRSLPAYQRTQARSDAGFQQTRQIPVFQQVLPPVVELREAEPQASDRYERQSAGGYGGNDHVDYGAYTGGYGAFGWYSDHPVCTNCGHGYH